MATLIIGKEALTSVRLADGSRANVSAGTVVPADADQGDVDRLIEEQYLEEVEYEVEGEAAADSIDESLTHEELLKLGVGAILDHVDDDAALAAELLALETGEGGKNRPKLVKGLEETIEAAAAAADALEGSGDSDPQGDQNGSDASGSTD